jgi:small-conductance mechanosensitive channel
VSLLPIIVDFLDDRQFLGATLLRWGEAAIAAIAGFALLVLIRRLLIQRLGAMAARTTTQLDDIVVELVRRTQRYFLAVLALWPAAGFLQLSGRPALVLRILSVVLVTVQAAIWVGVAVTRSIEARLRHADPAAATTLGALSFLIRLALYAVLLLLALSNLGINVSALLAGLGIGGVAIALALQNILGDLFASLSIVLDKPFVVGDFVVVGDLMGNVEHIGLKTTRVRSLSGEQIVFANGDLLQSRVRNYKRMSQRRVLFTLGVVYETPTSKLGSIPDTLRSLVEAQEGVRFDRAHFKSFDDFALTFEVVYFVLDADYNRYMDIHQRILLAIARRFEAEGIAFAYPTRTLYLRSEAAPTPPPAPPG